MFGLAESRFGKDGGGGEGSGGHGRLNESSSVHGIRIISGEFKSVHKTSSAASRHAVCKNLLGGSPRRASSSCCCLMELASLSK